MSDHKYREPWLADAVERLRPVFDAAGLNVPELVRVTCGWPTRGALKGTIVGQCLSGKDTTDGVAQISVTPLQVVPIDVLDTLTHEVVHSILPEAKHGKAFAKASAQVGLVGPAKSNTAGPELRAKLEAIAEQLGPYPHAAPVPTEKLKGQTTRMLKIVCPRQADLHESGDNYVLRASRKVIDLGLGTCGVCGEQLEVSETTKGEGD